MRITMMAAMALTALAAMPAAAQTTAGSGQVNQSGTTTQTNGPFTATGNATGSSASGFTSESVVPSGALVEFNSSGAASSQVTVTPFSVTTTSAHAGSFEGHAFNGATLRVTDQTFGQSNGNVSFTANANANTTTFTAHTDFNIAPANPDTVVIDQPVIEMPN